MPSSEYARTVNLEDFLPFYHRPRIGLDDVIMTRYRFTSPFPIHGLQMFPGGSGFAKKDAPQAGFIFLVYRCSDCQQGFPVFAVGPHGHIVHSCILKHADSPVGGVLEADVVGQGGRLVLEKALKPALPFPTIETSSGGLVTAKDAARYLGVSLSHVYAMCRDKRMLSSRVGHNVQIPWSVLHAYANPTMTQEVSNG